MSKRIPTLAEIEAEVKPVTNTQSLGHKQLLTVHQRETYAQLLIDSPTRAQVYLNTYARVPFTPEQLKKDEELRLAELDNRLQNAMRHRLMTLAPARRERILARIERRKLVDKPLNRRV